MSASSDRQQSCVTWTHDALGSLNLDTKILRAL